MGWFQNTSYVFGPQSANLLRIKVAVNYIFLKFKIPICNCPCIVSLLYVTLVSAIILFYNVLLLKVEIIQIILLFSIQYTEQLA